MGQSLVFSSSSPASLFYLFFVFQAVMNCVSLASSVSFVFYLSSLCLYFFIFCFFIFSLILFLLAYDFFFMFFVCFLRSTFHFYVFFFCFYVFLFFISFLYFCFYLFFISVRMCDVLQASLFSAFCFLTFLWLTARENTITCIFLPYLVCFSILFPVSLLTVFLTFCFFCFFTVLSHYDDNKTNSSLFSLFCFVCLSVLLCLFSLLFCDSLR